MGTSKYIVCGNAVRVIGEFFKVVECFKYLNSQLAKSRRVRTEVSG